MGNSDRDWPQMTVNLSCNRTPSSMAIAAKPCARRLPQFLPVGASRLMAEHRFEVPVCMQNAGDAKWLRGRVIDNEVGKYRPEFQRLVGQVIANMSGAGRLREKPQCLSDFAQYIPGQCSAALLIPGTSG